MSFAGGGSDMRAFYQHHAGAVLSTAIDKFVMVAINRKFDNGIRVAYSRTEEVNSVAEVEHQLVRAALAQLGIEGGIEIATMADIPSRGTGLGSSSSFTVGLLNALNAFCGRHVTREYLAQESCNIEINICQDPIGKQDQYAAAYGGFNLIEFEPDESVRVTPVVLPPDIFGELQSRLLVFYTGKTRSASDILAAQTADVSTNQDKRNVLCRMVHLAHDCKRELEQGALDAFGNILHENWVLKKSLNERIASQEIDEWYEIGRRGGALGGKILGAGAGGFLLFYAPSSKHDHISHQLPHLRRIPLKFERHGSQIIFYDPTT